MKRWWCVVFLGVAAAGLGAGGADRLASLVEAERAFARTSVQTNQRDAFLANFADEGVVFTPAPANARELLLKEPPSPSPSPAILDWAPETGDVAASGDLGYTTGPYTLTERASGKRRSAGRFFTVWTWQDGRGWKVLADLGVQAEVAGDLRGQPFARATVQGQSGVGGAQGADGIRAAEAAMAGEAASRGWSGAYEKLGTADILVYRARQVSSGRTAITSLPSAPAPLTWQPLHAEASAAGDLGFAYGAYTSGLAAKEQKGFYLHVWKRGPSGWRLAADITNEAATSH